MKEKINSFSITTLLISLCTASFYGVFSSYIVNTSKTSSLLSIPIGFIISLIISKIFLTFFNKKEELNYTDKLKYLYPKLSIILNIISILCSIFGCILITYRLTTFLSNEYLISTPRYLISLLILILTYYTASKGIETVIRISVITFFISIAIFFFDFFSLAGQINFENYLPFITVSYNNIITSSIIFALYFSIPIIYINTIPMSRIKDKNNFKKFYYIMITASFIRIFLSLFTVIGVNGSKVTELFDYPIYSTLKRIRLFTILDSLENISISAWFLFIINTANVMLVYIFSSLKQIFKLNKKKSTIFNIIIIIICFSIPNLIFNRYNFNESYSYIYIPVIFLLITLFIVILSLIKLKFKQKKYTN